MERETKSFKDNLRKLFNVIRLYRTITAGRETLPRLRPFKMSKFRKSWPTKCIQDVIFVVVLLEIVVAV